jgi:hypothetical protein
MRHKIEFALYHDNYQNFKRYSIPRAQLVIADIPYNLGKNAYASSTEWYIDGDNKHGESDKAGKHFFHTDGNFNLAEYMHFCSKLLIKEPKEELHEQLPLLPPIHHREVQRIGVNLEPVRCLEDAGHKCVKFFQRPAGHVVNKGLCR